MISEMTKKKKIDITGYDITKFLQTKPEEPRKPEIPKEEPKVEIPTSEEGKIEFEGFEQVKPGLWVKLEETPQKEAPENSIGLPKISGSRLKELGYRRIVTRYDSRCWWCLRSIPKRSEAMWKAEEKDNRKRTILICMDCIEKK